MHKVNNIIKVISPVAYLIARIAFGLLMISHGYPKLLDMQAFINNVGKMGFPLPIVLGPIAMASELLGGLLVAIGFKTRLACVFILGTMLGAVFIVHASDPFQKKEFALVYALLALVFMAKGSGIFAIDKDK